MISDFKEISRIKELLGKSPKGMSITELASALALHRNTVAKYLDVLQLKGDVDLKRIGTAKNYFLTTRVPASSIHAFCRSDYILANGRMEVVLAGGAMEWTGDPAAIRPGHRIPDMLPALANHPGFLENCQTALNGEDVLEEVRIPVGGQERHLRLHFLPVVFDDGREGLGLLLGDLTTCRAAETELARCRDRYHALAEEREDYLFRAYPDGTIISANPAFCRRIRNNPEDVIGFRHIPMISGAERTRLAQAISGLAPDSPNASIVYQATDAEGENRWEEWRFRGIFGFDGELVEYLATGRDITDLRRMEEQLRTYRDNLETLVKQRTREMQQANQTLMNEIAEREAVERELLFTRFAFDHASDSIILFDRRGSVYRANRTGCLFLGYTPEGILQRTIFDINPEITMECWNRMWANAEEVTWKRVISVHRKKDGTIIPVDLSRNFVKFGDREYFCSIARERV